MAIPGITFNGVHSNTLPLVMLDSRRPLFAQPKDTYVDVPYRSSSIIVPDSSMYDIEVEVDFLLKTPSNSTVYVEARKVAQWLTTHQTRKPLIFDDDPDFTYQAKVSSGIPLEKVVKWGTFTVVFRCAPHTPGEVTP